MAKKSYENVPLRVNKWTLISFAMVVVIIIGSIILLTPSAQEKLARAYRAGGLDRDHVFVEVSEQKLYDLVATGERIHVYYGHPNCSACMDSIQMVNTTAKDLNITTVYYLKAGFFDLPLASSEAMITRLQNNLGIVATSTPAVWTFENGTRLRENFQYYDDQSQTNYVNGMTFASVVRAVFNYRTT